MNPAAIGMMAGAGASALGTASQSQQNLNIAEYNAKALRYQANQASRAGAANEESSLRGSALDLGEQAAAIGQANIGTGGSAAEIMKESAANARLDALNTWYGGELQRHGLVEQAKLETWKAQQIKDVRKPGFLEKLLDPVNLIAPGLGATDFSVHGMLRKSGMPTAGDLLYSGQAGAAGAGAASLYADPQFTNRFKRSSTSTASLLARTPNYGGGF